jgi:thiamine-phosphate pyrophosphorylase
MRLELGGLYAVTPEREDASVLLGDVAAVLAGGCRMLQYRDKSSAMPEKVARARALRDLTGRHRARLVINDDIALCFLVGADGVHLGSDDGNLRAARAMLGPDRVLGASCYDDFSAARAADAAGADYIAFGAAYPSPTKPAATRAGFDLFRQGRAELRARTCAIGGITADNAPPLLAAGAELLAVITDIFSAPDIRSRTIQFQRLFEEARP